MSTNELHETPLGRLLKHFEQCAYTAGGCEKDTTEYEIIEHCSRLFRLDYNLMELTNFHGEHCSQYPAKILIPECEKGTGRDSAVPQHNNDTIYEAASDMSRLRGIIPQAKFARCRKRFPVPVIFFRGRYICRSSTVSLNMESSGRRVLEIASQKVGSISDTIRNVCLRWTGSIEIPAICDSQKGTESGSTSSASTSASTSTYTSTTNSEASIDEQPDYDGLDLSVLNNDPVYKFDLDLLQALDIGAIADLMVEMKKVKFWMFVSSSEKADEMNRYADYEIISIPYPGCEFFKTYRENSYEAHNIRFNWDQNFVDAKIAVPENPLTQTLQVKWDEYKKWDLVEITQNYLKVILKYVQDYSKSLLIHCISGWDRTPLFISLVRLSLWADGLVHKSLTAAEITYFTVAYDWYLFGHQLPDRRAKLEEILFFCFDFLKHIESDDYKVEPTGRIRTKTFSSNSSIVIIPDGALLDDEDDENISPNASRLDNAASHKSSTESLSMNRSPQKKSSPLSMQGGRRQRNESTSSNDWVNVTETGSVESSGVGLQYTSRAYMERANARNNTASRQERLKCVRAYFIKIYANVLDFQGGTNMGLRDLLENFVTRIADTFR